MSGVYYFVTILFGVGLLISYIVVSVKCWKIRKKEYVLTEYSPEYYKKMRILTALGIPLTAGPATFLIKFICDKCNVDSSVKYWTMGGVLGVMCVIMLYYVFNESKKYKITRVLTETEKDELIKNKKMILICSFIFRLPF